MKYLNKILLLILSGKHDNNIYYKLNIPEIINIQPKGNKAKNYQVKQIRKIIHKYNLGGILNV